MDFDKFCKCFFYIIFTLAMIAGIFILIALIKACYAKIRYAEPGIDERVIAVPSGEFVADRFGTDEEYDKLELYAVLDQYDCFVTDEPECREIIENRDRSKWLYVFDCHI